MLGVIPGQDTPIGEVIHVLAEIGVSILLFEIGLETDLKEMFRVGKEAAAVALVGVVLPFGLGFGYWYMANPAIGAHPTGIDFWIVAIFVGATLTATSVGITARVLSDLGKMHTSEARIIIGAAVMDDVLGIVILAVVAGLASGAAVGAFAISRIFVFAIGFLVLAVVIGSRAAPYLFNVVDRMRVRGVLLVTAFCFALLLAALADLAGSAMIIGAFAAGIVLSSTNQFDAVVERIEPVADVFTPIFFVVVGAPVNVRLFIPGSEDFSGIVLTVGLILTVIAVVGKVAAGFVVRKPGINRLAIGVGMVPRGEVGLIFAAIGLREGILSNAVYSAVLIMVILSTFMVPPFLKSLLQRGDVIEPEEVALDDTGSGPPDPAARLG
jgi:Kef-type K+ transport system membrane component KefB